MFILNKETKLIQECSHRDVIKCCQKDSEHYAVAESVEALKAEAAKKPQQAHQEPQEAPDNEGGEENTEAVEKQSEGKSEAQEGNSEGQGEEQDAAGGDVLNGSGDEMLSELNAKSVKDLREIAKAKGIKGYANMNKDTLVALIMDLA